MLIIYEIFCVITIIYFRLLIDFLILIFIDQEKYKIIINHSNNFNHFIYLDFHY